MGGVNPTLTIRHRPPPLREKRALEAWSPVGATPRPRAAQACIPSQR